MKLCIVKNRPLGPSETFILAQADGVVPETDLLHGFPPVLRTPAGDEPLLSTSAVSRIASRVAERLRGSHRAHASALYTRVLKRLRADVVLAQYGTTGVLLMDACRKLNIPLIVHFHGYDASRRSVLEQYRAGYSELWSNAAAIVGVSKAMVARLIEMGAPPARTHLIPCGVKIDGLPTARPGDAEPTFVFAGRLVEKKAPHLTILAFRDVVRDHPEARLRIIGDGELMGVCGDLVQAYGLEGVVTFLGMQPHEVVLREMSGARAYVQHSVTAVDGDSEGTPVAVMEASAMGLPVVSTFHAGIPDVIGHEETGLLVDERDIRGMAGHMAALVRDASYAANLGNAGRIRSSEELGLAGRLTELRTVIQEAVNWHAGH